MITIIVAMTKEGVIGKSGGMPWRLPQEMRHFTKSTMGHPVVVGRKTFESIGKPLKGRDTIVVSRTMGRRDDVTVCRTLPEALEAGSPGDELFIAGGAEVYRQALPVADRMLISYLREDYPGDTTFPEVDLSDWEEVCRESHESFEVVDYRRRDHKAARQPPPAQAGTTD